MQLVHYGGAQNQPQRSWTCLPKRQDLSSVHDSVDIGTVSAPHTTLKITPILAQFTATDSDSYTESDVKPEELHQTSVPGDAQEDFHIVEQGAELFGGCRGGHQSG